MDGLSTQSSDSKLRKKGIIKKGSSDPGPRLEPDAPHSTKTARFDEENIKKTYRPAEKDYGFDKILEPKTPYERWEGPVDPNKLQKRLLEFAQESDGECDDEQQQSSSNLDRHDDSMRRGSEISAISNRSAVSASLSITSNSSLSFQEKRRKHTQAEFAIAKQISKQDLDSKEECSGRK